MCFVNLNIYNPLFIPASNTKTGDNSFSMHMLNMEPQFHRQVTVQHATLELRLSHIYVNTVQTIALNDSLESFIILLSDINSVPHFS